MTNVGYKGIIMTIINRKKEIRAVKNPSVSGIKLKPPEDGIITIDFETGIILDVNSLVEKILGCSHEELVGKAIREIGFFKDITGSKDKFSELRQKKHTRHENLPLETVNGRRINIELISKVYTENDRKVIQWRVREKTKRKNIGEELRESEEKFRMVFENVFDGISLYSEDPDPLKRKLFDCNDRYAVMAGRSREELLKLESLEGIQTALDNTANKNRLESLETGTAFLGTFSWIRPDGKENIIEYVGKPITWRGKKYMIGIDRDITGRKLEENKLIENEAKFHRTFDHSPVGSAFVDLDQRFIKCNLAFCNFLGYKENELIGKAFSDITYPEDMELGKKELKQIVEGEIEYCSLRKRYLRKDGNIVWGRINIGLIRDANDKPLFYLPIIQDITEVMTIEAGLEKTRQELAVIKKSADEVSEFAESLINTVREPLIALDKDLRVVKASRSFYEFFKVSSGETIGTLIYDLGNRQWDIPKLKELLETILPEKTTFDNYEVEHDFSTIGKRIMLLNARKIQTGSEKEQVILLAIEDITERKKNENELAIAKAEAEQANAAKSEFLSRMSHELRTPMNSILGFAQLMDMGELNPNHKKGVNQILKNGKHLLELINEVLDIARIETGRVAVSLEPVEISQSILETIDIVRNLAEENHITVEPDASIINGLFVKADHQRFKQVLLNLITNAIKYNVKGGSVKVECKIRKQVKSIENAEGRAENVIRISVIDTGKGIAKEYIEKLFNPFERIGAERTETEGTGLGLAISKKLVEAMSGKVGVESETGKGSAFWIELPQTESQKDRYERIREFEKPEAETTQPGRTVLYIEDNISNIQLVEEILKTHRPSIKLITNIYGNNAVKFAIDYKPDLILLDLDLPDIHGSEVIKLLQAEPVTSQIPVIILSADAFTKQIKQLMKTGAKDYLIKPIDVVNFLTVVDEWVRKIKP
jgi:PAS domain S-box-containing protein